MPRCAFELILVVLVNLYIQTTFSKKNSKFVEPIFIHYEYLLCIKHCTSHLATQLVWQMIQSDFLMPQNTIKQ